MRRKKETITAMCGFAAITAGFSYWFFRRRGR